MSTPEPSSPVPTGPDTPTKAGFVAVLGAPNAGKSTLVNQLVGQHVAIVTPKAQTTRTRVLGIVVDQQSQLVLVDTPGIFTPGRRLDRAMVQAAWTAAGETDLALLLVDAHRASALKEAVEIAGQLATLRPQGGMLLALNKVDLIRPERLLPWTAALTAAARFERVFMISALDRDGVDDLRADLLARLPPGPWLFPPDEATTQTARQLAAEITREQLFIQLHQELPYQLTVETETWEDFKDGSVRIGQLVTIERESHKAIVLGNGGTRIKAVREAATQTMVAEFDRPVHLFLHVRVREGWADNRDYYEQQGLDYDA